ncbi:MAG: UDP-N-acetylmuramate dehydrogenase [Planctomycetes bacterium]|nr:UDP-N-acetylmuramate dehydrogenase [Planctomycetota bacterium]MCL4729578.1 UDP-N-acetylmuramate dehydrogenase [Planctomycetota bacterium]
MTLSAFPPRIRARVQREVPLAQFTTWRIGGPAEYLVHAASLRDVADTVAACKTANLPLYVLGGGSNLLIDDAGVRGVVLSLHAMKKMQAFGNKVHVEAGASLGTLVTRCNHAGIGGPHGLAGIPGTVGGALAMNAGGRHAEIADFVERVVWINPQGELESLYREEIDFGYRRSGLRFGVVIEAVLAGRHAAPAELLAATREIMREKLAVQPYQEFSAGCCFQNPMGSSAGRLIDLAGCKGLAVGDAVVSPMHGNFIVNAGRASCAEVLELMRQVTQRVAQTHGVVLKPEVQMWPARDVLSLAA